VVSDKRDAGTTVEAYLRATTTVDKLVSVNVNTTASVPCTAIMTDNDGVLAALENVHRSLSLRVLTKDRHGEASAGSP
jgi:hypothetical protein